MIVNKIQLSQIIGKSEVWLSEMQKTHDFPIEKRGRGRAGQLYDTQKVIKWLEQRQINHLTGGEGLIDLEEAKRRKMAAEASLVELELMKEQGLLVEVNKIADDFGEQLSNFKAKMISIPSKCAAQVLTCDNVQEIKSILEDAIYEALNEVRGIGNFNADGELAEGDSEAVLREAEATAKADDLAVG